MGNEHSMLPLGSALSYDNIKDGRGGVFETVDSCQTVPGTCNPGPILHPYFRLPGVGPRLTQNNNN